MTTQKVEQVLSPYDLVARWQHRVSARTLANWRSLSTGPRYIKLGGRIIYKLSSIEEFEDNRTVSGTAEYKTKY